MAKKCCAPVIINLGVNDESPGVGGAVDSVVGLGVVDATPSVGDVEVSLVPGTEGQILTTNSGVPGWETLSGQYNTTVLDSNNIVVQTAGQCRWFRLGGYIFVIGRFSGTPGDANAGDVTLDIPIPGSTTALNIYGVLTAIRSDDNVSTAGDVGGNNLILDSVRCSWGPGLSTLNVTNFRYSYSYPAA